MYLFEILPERRSRSPALSLGESAYMPTKVATNEHRDHTKNSNDSAGPGSAPSRNAAPALGVSAPKLADIAPSCFCRWRSGE